MIRFLDELKKLNLGDSYVILGSGALAVRGIRENKDLDVLVDKNTFGKLKKKFGLNEKKNCIEIGNIEVWDNFKPWFEDSNLLIKDCDVIKGFRFMKLKYLISWKERLRREKDLEDLKLVEKYLKRTNSIK